MAITLSFLDSGFPSSTFSGTVQDLVDAFVENLSATIPTSSLILGQVNGSAPTSDIGPWLDGRIWKAWNGSAYTPVILQVGGATSQIQFGATPTADRTLTLQDKTGTLALTDDVFVPRVSINLATTTPAHQMDWQSSFSFYEAISTSPTYTIVNSLPGQKVAVALIVTGTHTPVFPTSIKWLGGSVPGAVTNTTNLYLIENVAGSLYGQELDAFS